MKATYDVCKDQIVNLISSAAGATGHVGIDQGLQYREESYVWGLTMEKVGTKINSQKFRILLIRQNFLSAIGGDLENFDDEFEIDDTSTSMGAPLPRAASRTSTGAGVRSSHKSELMRSKSRKVVPGQSGYHKYKKDRWDKLMTLKRLRENEVAGSRLFLIGEISIAVAQPGSKENSRDPAHAPHSADKNLD